MQKQLNMNSGLVAGGYVCVALLPIAATVIACILLSKGATKHGVIMFGATILKVIIQYYVMHR